MLLLSQHLQITPPSPPAEVQSSHPSQAFFDPSFQGRPHEHSTPYVVRPKGEIEDQRRVPGEGATRLYDPECVTHKQGLYQAPRFADDKIESSGAHNFW